MKKCVGKETLERMNYLYQISNEVIGTSKNDLTYHYLNLMHSISKKANQRIDVNLKRTICKNCMNLMISGITCKVRIKKKHVKWTCNNCGFNKIFRATEDYYVWSQKAEALVETLNYTPEDNIKYDVDNAKK